MAKSKAKKNKDTGRKPFLSDRQRKVLLIIILAMLILVPVIQVIKCKSECLKKKMNAPYPEIACKYDCPWPWERR